MNPEDLARSIAQALQQRQAEPPVARHLRASGEALGALDPLMRAFWSSQNVDLQLRLLDEMRDACLRAAASITAARTSIAEDPAAAFAPLAQPVAPGPEGGGRA